MGMVKGHPLHFLGSNLEQKVEFMHEWLTQKYTITELCRSFNISRPTAYKLISRY
jgi:predicted DNA-binding protein YlxM (UPF0122 family)